MRSSWWSESSEFIIVIVIGFILFLAFIKGCCWSLNLGG